MTLFLLVLLIAVVLGFVGAIADGLFYLLIIGAVLFAADLVFAGMRLRRSGRRPVR